MTEVSAALRDLQERLLRDPDNLRLRIRVATLLRQVGRSVESATLLRSVAFAYRDCGQYDEAIAVARSILEIDPADAAIAELVTELERRSGEVTASRGDVVAKAEQALVQAATVEPISERAQSASLAAVIARPRIPSRPPPLRAQMGPHLVHSPTSEDTPLPGALPYHIAEPTTPASKLPVGVGSGRTEGNDSSRVAGLAEAARRISGLIAHDGENTDLLVDSQRSLPRGQTSPPVPIHDAPPGRVNLHGAGDAEEELTTPRDIPVGDLFSDPTPHFSKRAAPVAGAGTTDPLTNLFFSALSESDRKAALAKFESQHVPAGAIVIRQGAAAQPLIAVIRGRLELRVERANSPVTILETVEAGFFVGEAVLLGRASAPATVVAAVDCDLLTLSPHALFELATVYPALWAALKDSAERRTRRYDSVMRALP